MDGDGASVPLRLARSAARLQREWERLVFSLFLSLLGIRRRGPGSIAQEVEFRRLLDAETTDEEDLALEEWAARRYRHLRD